ncbi:MAG: DUF401 family protein [Candidatus Cloacimonetes bacterium]|nr:DUF401 family protein [Candidatus Cloacimonadota bacterium]
MQIWLSFLIALVIILFIARKSLWLALFIGSLFLGSVNLSFRDLYSITFHTITDQQIVLLATAVGIISLIGGGLQISGLLQDLVNNLQVKRKVFLGFAPALMGLLPIPGGALLSAPMLNRCGKDISPVTYTSINIWFRHILILIYPLGALLPCSKMGNFNVYTAMLYIFPIFIILFYLGYYFYLRQIKGEMPRPFKFDKKKLIIPLMIILSAPIIHTILNFAPILDEAALVTAVLITLIITFLFGKLTFRHILPVINKMKPWRYFLIIISIFLFLKIFQATEISARISLLNFSQGFLLIVIAGSLSFVSGRVQLAISILIPIFLAKFGAEQFTIKAFVIMYTAVYLGYMISPIHAWVIVTMEYFKTTYWQFVKQAYLPTLIGFLILYLLALLTL